MRLSLLLCLLAVMLTGCATVYRDPRTSSMPSEKVAVLEQPFSEDLVFITEVNGRDRGTGFFVRFILPPGRNAVRVMGNSHGGIYEDPTTLTFTAEAGRVYVLKYDTGPRASLLKPSTWTGPGSYRAWIIEKDTGRAVDDASLAASQNTGEPNKPPQHNAGSPPSSDDSPVSETPSSLGPRG